MFEDLITKINMIEKKLSLLLNLHMEQTNSLTTYNQVADFLGMTTRTIHNYIKDQKLVADKHFYINKNGKTVFIPDAIIQFKHASIDIQSVKKLSATTSKVMHPITSNILKGVA